MSRVTVRLVAVLVCALIAAAVADAQSFRDDFDSPTLDPAWETWVFSGTRSHGYTTPANHYSLTDSPGSLRYGLDPMTHFDGFVNGYQQYYSTYWYDPGLEISRSLVGERWRLETKVTHYLPYTNGRLFSMRAYFGDGGPGTVWMDIMRGRDNAYNALRFSVMTMTGPTWPGDQVVLATAEPVQSFADTQTVWLRIERDGGILTGRFSLDGVNWNLGVSHDLGSQLTGLAQRVTLAGQCWFNPAGSYADYDYIDFAQEPTVTLLGGAGDQRAVAAVATGGLTAAGNALIPGSLGWLSHFDVLPPEIEAWRSVQANPDTWFTGVARVGSTTFAVGGAVPPSCGAVDGVGGTEDKALLARHDASGLLLGCQSTNVYGYTGGEGYAAVASATLASGPFAFATGRGENCGFGYNVFFLDKYTESGVLAGRATEEGSGSCVGFSQGRGLVFLDGFVYVAGHSGLNGLGEDGGWGTGTTRPVLMKYDTNLARVWKQRPTESAGFFNAVAALSGHLYAVGNTYVSPGTGNDPIPVAGSADYLIEKYDANGTRLWRQVWGGGNDDVLTGVVAIGSRLFAVGHTRSSGAGGADGVAFEIDPADGSRLQEQLWGGAQDDMLNAAATDGRDLYAVGESRSYASDEGNTAGENEVVILRLAVRAAETAPEADAGVSQLLVASTPTGAVATLDASASTDPDGDPLTYTWTGPFPENDGIAWGASPSVTLPVGSHVITLTVSDGVLTATDVVTIDVENPTLTVTRAGTGAGTVTSGPAGIDCGATCQAEFPAGTEVTLTAAPDGMSTFDGWSGAGCSGTGTCMVTMADNVGVQATFSTLCAYALDPTGRTVLAAGATGTVALTASAGCAWTAASNDAWITVTGGASGVGPGVVSYAVEANPGAEPRTGTITIAGQTFTVSQNGTQALLLRVTGSINGNSSLGMHQWLAASFTLSRTFTNVAITPNVSLGGCSGRAWLTRALGGSATWEDVLHYQDFVGVSGPHSFFTGLTLGPGTYYFLISVASGDGGWPFAHPAVVSTAPGVAAGNLLYASSSNTTLNTEFPPATSFIATSLRELIDVTGDSDPYPVVVATSPLSNALDAGAEADLTVTFNTSMQASTVDASTFVLDGSLRGRYPGTVTYDESTRTARFDPAIPFLPGERLTATVTTGVHSLSGEPLTKPHVFRFRAAPAGGFARFRRATPAGGLSGSWLAHPADLDGDGDLDLLSVNTMNQMLVLLNGGAGVFGPPASHWLVTSAVNEASLADINADGRPDIVAISGMANQTGILRNHGDGTFGDYDERELYGMGEYVSSHATGDLDGDGDVDIVTIPHNFLGNDGTGAFTVEDRLSTEDTGSNLVDVDNDGDLDQVAGYSWFAGLQRSFNAGDATFGSSYFDIAFTPRLIVGADFDGDHDADIVVGSSESNQLALYRNDGSGTFALGSTWDLGSFGNFVTACDLDGDADLDLAVSTTGQVAIYTNDGTGAFAKVKDYAVASPGLAACGDFTGDGLLDLAVPNDATIEILENADVAHLAVTKTGSGTGVVQSTPAGIDCGPTCEGDFPWSSGVSLSAAPDPGSRFNGWSGDCSGAGSCDLTMDADRAVQAEFTAVYELTVSHTGGGAVVSDPAGIDCGATCGASYDAGTLVTLTALPGPGASFAGWGGACQGLEPTCGVTMTEARSVTAAFDVTLTVRVAGHGTGHVVSAPEGIDCGAGLCPALFPAGTSVTLTGTPSGSSTFAGFSGACTSAGPTCDLALTSSLTVLATFDGPPLTSLAVTPATPSADAGEDRWLSAVGTFADASTRILGVNTLAGRAGSPFAIATDAKHVYWTEWDSGAVKKTPLAGGPITTLATGINQPTFIAVSGGFVIFVEELTPFRIGRVPVDGGDVVVLANVPPDLQWNQGAHGLAVDGEYVYWTEGCCGGGRVMRVPLGGGTAEVLAQGVWGGNPSCVAADATSVYFTDFNGRCGWSFSPNGEEGRGGIFRLPRAGGDWTLLVQGLTNNPRIAVDPTHLYWATTIHVWGASTLQRLPLSGGTVETLTSSLPTGVTDFGLGLALDAGYAYLTSAAAGSLLKVSLAGGAPVVVASGLDTPRLVVPVGDRLFWTEGGTNGAVRSIDRAGVTWTSSDPAVATIDARGRAHAVAPGVATLTATSGSASGTASLTVHPTPTALSVSPATARIAVGGGQPFVASATLSDSSTRPLAGGTSSQGTALPAPRRWLSAAEHNGLVYTFGGCGDECHDPAGHPSTDEETTVTVYDPAGNAWTTLGRIPVVHAAGEAVAPGNGRIYLMSGYLQEAPVLEYDPATDTWVSRSPMPLNSNAGSPAAAALNGKIHVFGGAYADASREYDPETDTWTVKASMPTNRHTGAVAVALDHTILVIGGGNYGESTAVDEYDPATDSWTARAPFPVPIGSAVATSANGKVYVLGGLSVYYASTVFDTVYEYDPTTDAWTPLPAMPAPVAQAGAATAGDRVFVVGGIGATDQLPRTQNDAYTPYEAQWSTADPLVASIDRAGAATGVAPGSTTVTAAWRGVSGDATLEVSGPPVAHDQSVTTAEETPIAITLAASDPEADPLTFAVVAPPVHGVLTGDPPDLTYSPVLDYFGPDSFTFRANDGTADSNEATVGITVTNVNDPPVAYDQTITVPENTPTPFTLTGSDPDGDPLDWNEAGGPYNGSVTGQSPNITYTPNPGFIGTDTFLFQANDGQVGGNMATITFQVARFGHDPVFVNVPDTESPSGYVTGDLNGDGRLDLVAQGRSSGVPRLMVLIQNAEGRYEGVSQEPMGADEGLSDAQEGLALGDLDGDGDLDLVAQGLDNAGSLRLLWFRNDGGTLVEQPDFGPGLHWGAVATGDFDNDGRLDVVASGEDTLEEWTGGEFPHWRFLIYRNNGDGTFALVQEPRGELRGYTHGASLAVGDVDSDGWLDIVASGGGEGRALHFWKNSGGTFGLRQALTVVSEGLNGSFVRLADTDLDGDLDLLAAGGNNVDGTERRWFVHFRNEGGAFDTAFTTVKELGSNDGWAGLAVADATGDGYPDVLVNEGVATATPTVVFRNVGGTLVEGETIETSFSGPVIAGDFDQDQDVDFVGLPVRDLFENVAGPANAAPGAPTNLTSAAGPGGAHLTWTAPADAETPGAALGYEIRVGTASGVYDLVSGAYGTPLAGSFPLGRIAAGQPGRILDLPVQAYYWQVRAIDSGLRVGEWSDESSFVPPVKLSMSGDVTVTEPDAGGTVQATFTVAISAAPSQDVTVEYSTQDGSATAGTDYEPATGTVLTFPAGDSSARTFSITVNGDDLAEAATEDLFVHLQDPSPNAILVGDTTARVTITENEPATFRADDAAVVEGQSGSRTVYVAVRLSRPMATTATVSFATANGTATSSDYTPTNGTLTFTAGTTLQTLQVTVTGDNVAEADETFFVNLTGSTGAPIGDAQGVVTLLDDDVMPTAPDTLGWTVVREGHPDLNGVASNGSLYVMVANYGEVYTSVDGASWTRIVADPGRRNVRAVLHDGEQFLAVGEWSGRTGDTRALAMTSTNGTQWTLRDTGADGNDVNLRAVASGAGRYVAVGDAGKVLWSTDALTWTAGSSGTTENLHGVAFGDGLFTAVGRNGTVRTSPDGTSWTASALPGDVSPTATLNGVTHTGTQFVAVGNDNISGPLLMTSPDGSVWTRRSAPCCGYSGVTAAGGLVVAFGWGSISVSSNDGVDWTRQELQGAELGAWTNVSAGALGPAGFVACGPSGALYTAPPDASSWTMRTLPESRSLSAVAEGNGLVCAVGRSVARSADGGVSWTDSTLPDYSVASYAVAYGNGRFVAAAEGGLYATTDCLSSWTTGAGTGDGFGSNVGLTFNDVTFGAGRFVAAGFALDWNTGVAEPLLHTSTDGLGWTRIPLDLGANFRLFEVAWGNGRFVVVGRNTQGVNAGTTWAYLTSEDGLNWSSRPWPLDTNLFSRVTFAGGRFLAYNWTSTDGLAWTRTGSAQSVQAYGAGRWLASAWDGRIPVSADAVHWTPNTTGTAYSLSGAVYLESLNRFVAVGDSAIVYSGVSHTSFSVGNATVLEGDSGETDAVFTVTMFDHDGGQPVSFNWATEDKSALAGSDYVGATGTVSFDATSPRTASQTFVVKVLGDTTIETDEMFAVNLSGGSGGMMADGTGIGIILNDEAVPSVSIDDATVTEGNLGDYPTVTLAATLSYAPGPGQTATVAWGTANGTAWSGSWDFTSAYGAVTFGEGEITKDIVVTVRGDGTWEPTEHFFVNLSNPLGATIADGQATVTINDDDPVPTVSIAQASIPEGQSGTRTVLVTASLSNPSSAAVTVDYATTDGTALAGVDYAAQSGTLTFPSANDGTYGSSTQVIPITVNGDTASEGDETFLVNLSNASVAIATSQATVTILDDEGVPEPPAEGGWQLALEGIPAVYAAAYGNGLYALAGAAGEIWTSADTESWTKRQADPQNRVFRAITYANGRFVAVSQAGGASFTPAAVWSTDGVDWNAGDVTAAGNRNLFGVAYGAGLFAAVSNGPVYTSPDGALWTQRATPSGGRPNAITFGTPAGADLFVAVGNSGRIMTSPDGIAWLNRSAPVPSTLNLWGVAWTGTRFVAVGGDSTGALTQTILTSADGVTWTLQAQQTRTLNAVAAGPGLVVAVGNGDGTLPGTSETWTSTDDGTTWTNLPLSSLVPGVASALRAVTHGPAGYLAAGAVGSVYTSDGTAPWSHRSLAASRIFVSVAHDGTRFCAVDSRAFAATSTDGVTWTYGQALDPASYGWNEVLHANGAFVAVGWGDAVATSSDCVSWTQVNPADPLVPGAATTSLTRVAYGEGRYVAVGYSAPVGAPIAPRILTSADGATWTETPSNLPPTSRAQLVALAYGAGRFVAVGEDFQSGVRVSILTSEDGVTWTPRDSSFFDQNYEDVNDLVYANGQFILTTDRIWGSTDGIHWTLRRDYTDNDYFRAVGHASGRFVAVGNTGAIATSPDGYTWTKSTSPTAHDLLTVAPAEGGTRVVAGGASAVIYSDVAPGQARISGRVTDAVTSSPITSAPVQVGNAAGDTLVWTGPDENGFWFADVPPGTYYVKVENVPGHMGEIYQDIPCLGCSFTSGTPIVVAGGEARTGIDLALTPGGGTIAGRFTDAETGLPITNAHVNLYSSTGVQLGFGFTYGDPDGSYLKPGLPAGTYYVQAWASDEYVPEYWDGKQCPPACNLQDYTPVTVNEGETTTGIDFAMDKGGRVSGTVRDAVSGDGLPNAPVDIVHSTGSGGWWMRTDSAGAYVTGALPPGTYYAKAENVPGHLGELYEELPCLNCDATTGASFQVVKEQTTTGIDFTLTPGGGGIAGRLTDAVTGAPLYPAHTNIYSASGQTVGFGHTDTSGDYVLHGLPAGTYFVQAWGQNGYLNETWDDKKCPPVCDVTSGDPVVVTEGSVRSGIDIALEKGGTIAGTVTEDLSGLPLQVTVWVWDDTGSIVSWMTSNADGTYSTTLLPGQYRVVAGWNSPTHVGEIHDGIQFTNWPWGLTGTAVTVTAEATTTVDFQLAQVGRIQGTVRDALTSQPIANERACIWHSWGFVCDQTDVDGVYTITGLPAEDYPVYAGGDAGYGILYYDGGAGQPSYGTVPPGIVKVAVTAGQTAGPIDFALAAGARIDGSVTEEGTGLPLADVTIKVFSEFGQQVTSAKTDAAGHYLVGGLGPGTWYLRTHNAAGYLNECYGGAACPVLTSASNEYFGADFIAGAPLALAANQAVSGVDFVLAQGGRISGRITNAQGQRIGGGITVFDSSRRKVAGGNADNEGHYITDVGLPTGTYYVLATAGQYVAEVFNNYTCLGCDPTTGVPVPVTMGQITSGRDFVLARGGQIAGRIVDAATGKGFPANVEVWSDYGQVINTYNMAGGDFAGAYVTSGLPAGTYYLRTDNWSGYADEAYGGAVCTKNCTPIGTTPVSVTEGAVTWGIDFALDKAALLTGTVTNSAGDPMGGLLGTVYDAGGMRVTDWVTDPLGRYTTYQSLPPGSYRARTKSLSTYLDEVYAAKPCIGTCDIGAGDNIVVTGPGTVAGVDLVLWPALTVSDAAVEEDAGNAQFTVTLSHGISQPVTVQYATSDQTATAGSDYTATSGTLTLDPGATTASIVVPITDDGTYEADETFSMSLSAPSRAVILDATAVGTIAQNDAPPSTTEPVVWTQIVGLQASGSSLLKTAVAGWGNGGAVSTQQITSGDGYVEFTASEASTYRMIGLSNGNRDASYQDIDFAIYLMNGTTLIYEKGVNRGNGVPYVGGDVFRVAVQGGVVRYSKNGTVFYTSSEVPVYPLLVDTSFYTPGSTVSFVVISGNTAPPPPPPGTEAVVWTSLVGVEASGNSLTKTAIAGWGNGGAVSTQQITSGDGYVEFTASESTTFRMIGLSSGNQDASYQDIDFAVYLLSGQSSIYEKGINRGNGVTYASGDVFRVAVVGGVVEYSKNGTVFYSSSQTPVYPLLVDTSLYTSGSTVSYVVISGNTAPPPPPPGTEAVVWTSLVGVTPNGNSLTKTSGTGWDAGAVSTQQITSGDGYVEFTASEASTYRMIGLSNGNRDASYQDIDFAIYLMNGTTLIYEKGVNRGNGVPYVGGDVFRVAVQGGVVRYSKNGTVFYTSSEVPVYPLLVDTSFYTQGATLSFVVIAGSQ